MKKRVRGLMMRCLLVFILAPVLLLNPYSRVFAERQSRPSVLIIYSFNRSFPLSARFFSGFTEALEPFDLNTFEIFQENLDADRIDSAEYLDSLAASYIAKYASKKFDAIITVNVEALNFLLRRCDSLSPGAVVVPVLLSQKDYPPDNLGRKIIPVLCDRDIQRTIDLILRLQPALGKLYIVSGTHPAERLAWDYVRQVISRYRDGPEFVFPTESRYDELLDAVSELGANDAVLYLTFMRDQAGRDYSAHFVVSRLSETAACPIYGISDTYMDCGIVGGAMFPLYRLGESAGNVLVSLLKLKNTTDVLAETRVPLTCQVDERQMVKWGLSENDLPEGYEVVNRAPSLWRDYRKHVGAALLFFLGQSALIFCLLIQRRSRKAAEQELRGTCQALEEKQEDLSRATILQDRTLASLRESEATLQSILASIPVGVLMIDVESGNVRKANRTAAELLGIPLEKIEGSHCPGSFEPFITREGLVPSRYGASSLEDELCSGQGRRINVLKTVDYVSLDGKVHLIGCLLDITIRKAAEREARERTEQLVHADKMISLGVMAAGITHEIHNPNNFISVNAVVLKRAWEDALEVLDRYAEENGDFPMGKLQYSRARQHIPTLMNGIVEGSERIKNIVRDMKEFVSSKPSGMTENVDINAVLRSSLNLLANKLSKSTKNLFIDYGESIPAVVANGQRVGQVMINLILNGAEALTDKEQSLSVRSYYEPEKARVILEVKDNGQGIRPEHLNRVFDPFFTTKRETGGTGLGLAISHKIIEAYGGRILISSTVGEGTTAVLELPACSKDNRSDS